MDKRKMLSLKGSCHDTVNLESDNNDPISFVLGFLKNLIGVKNIFELRISLPTHLLDSVSALEFWQYMDRPDIFATLSDPDDDIRRFLGILRWWFSKDSKWKNHVIKKPYNPILSEFFTCHWQIANPVVPVSSTLFEKRGSISSVDTESTLSDKTIVNTPYTVHYISEQVSHHPPYSAYFFQCPEKDIVASGIDHLAGKFTGTAFRVGPGDQNNGIHVMLNQRQEEYDLKHPWAQVAGFLSGSLYIACGGECIITCLKTNLKCIIEYKEESMWGKPKFAIEGKLFKYDYSNDDSLTASERKQTEQLSKVPSENIVATIWGAWNGQIFYRLVNDAVDRLLIDMQQSEVVEKIVRPLGAQAENESRRVWHNVTEALTHKDFNKANIEKRKIEDEQRANAAENAKNGVAFKSAWFDLSQFGKPMLKSNINLDNLIYKSE